VTGKMAMEGIVGPAIATTTGARAMEVEAPIMGLGSTGVSEAFEAGARTGPVERGATAGAETETVEA
jgi:hypothetical protein